MEANTNNLPPEVWGLIVALGSVLIRWFEKKILKTKIDAGLKTRGLNLTYKQLLNGQDKKTGFAKLFFVLCFFLFLKLPGFGQVCPAPVSVNIVNDVAGVNNQYDGIGISFDATAPGWYSIEINGVYYTTPERIRGRTYTRAVYPLSFSGNGIETNCNVWLFYKVAPFTAGQNITVSIVTYNSLGLVCGRYDYSHIVSLDLCKKVNK